ncbi:MAG: YceI family protein [Bacteroidia bacterium]|nr:YceI family protein [Bacteroidia bacterium]
MRNLLTILCICSLAMFMSCKGKNANTVEATAAEEVSKEMSGESFSVNVAGSSISWVGSKPGKDHSGTLALSDGMLTVDNGNITGGTFSIDMNSLKNTDLAGTEGAGKLEGHLKSEDFFNVMKFPNAKFTITKVTKVLNNPNMSHSVSGNLEMMGISKNITMPATIKIEDGVVNASISEFALNRTDWGVKYGSGLIGTALDKAISDDVQIDITLNANKS